MSREETHQAYLHFFRTTFKKIGILPEDGEEFSVRGLSRFFVPLVLSGGPLIFGLIGHMVKSMQDGDVIDFINDFCMVNLCLVFGGGLLMYLILRKKYLRLLHLVTNYKFGTPNNYADLNEKIENLSRIMLGFSIFLGMVLMVQSYLSDPKCNAKKAVDESGTFVCNQPISFWMPIRLNPTAMEVIMTICNAVMILFVFPPMAMCSMIYVATIKIIILRTEHLIYLLRQMNFNEPNVMKRRENFVYCIDYYNDLFLTVESMNSFLGYINTSMQGDLMMLNIAGLAYQLSMEFDITVVVQMNLWIGAKFAVAFCGQQLENASELLTNEVYNLPWYDLDSSLKTDFRMFFARTQKIFQFQVQLDERINMSYFRKYLKMTYSMFMFLKNFE